MSQWQPIETAPNGSLLLHDAASGVTAIGFFGKHNHVPIFGWVYQTEFYDGELDGLRPTHWMPLPPPPEADANEWTEWVCPPLFLAELVQVKTRGRGIRTGHPNDFEWGQCKDDKDPFDILAFKILEPGHD